MSHGLRIMFCETKSLILNYKNTTISHKNSETNPPLPNFNVLLKCDSIWVSSFCHSGSLYPRYNIDLGGECIRIGIYCTLSMF